MTVQPCSEWKKYRHYVTSFFLAAGVVCVIGIGVWFCIGECDTALMGLTAICLWMLKPIRGFIHTSIWKITPMRLARMYADYKYTDGGRGVMLYTTYPLGSLPLYRFLLYMCILAVLKVLFLQCLEAGFEC